MQQWTAVLVTAAALWVANPMHDAQKRGPTGQRQAESERHLAGDELPTGISGACGFGVARLAGAMARSRRA
jgi:hypothetical protein